MSQDLLHFENVLASLDQLEFLLASWTGHPDADEAAHMRALLDSIHQISRQAKTDHDAVDWRKFHALRNAFLHDYLRLSPSGIRSFLLNEMPSLRRAALAAVRETAASPAAER